MLMIKLSLSLATCFIVAASLAGDEPRRFRTDADGPPVRPKKTKVPMHSIGTGSSKVNFPRKGLRMRYPAN